MIRSISQDDNKLDQQIKRVLACKPILAVIFSEVIEECKDMSYEEIISCIEGEVQIDQTFVNPTEIISGNSQEDYLPGEYLVRYDIKTFLRLPNMTKPELAKIIIDLEAQKDDNPGYDIVVRGIFYACRMISSQLGTEFTDNSKDSKKYQNIKKVYSIWICTEVSKKKANTIEKYTINKEMLYGKECKDTRYDLITVIVINIGDNYNGEETDNPMLNSLNVLFNSDFNADIKIRRLKEYNVPVTKEVEKEVEIMTSYTANIVRKIEQSRNEGEIKGEAKVYKLLQLLLENNRADEIQKIASDETMRQKLYKEFNI